MSRTVLIDPVTRLEGHLAVKVEVADGKVSKAFCSGEMFRGFEVLLRGRSPLDAQQITQRICGVCPVSHGTASIFSQDDAYGLIPPDNGRLARNLILGANYLQSHIVHFYQLSALDFVDITALLGYTGSDPVLAQLRDWAKTQIASKMLFPAAPFLPRYEGKYIESSELNLIAIRHYVQALEMRRLAHQMVAIFGGKVPHVAALIPGGITGTVTVSQIAKYESMLKRVSAFIEQCYLPDVVEVAKAFPEYFSIGRGPENYLSYGNFPESSDPKNRMLPAGVVVQGKLSGLEPSLITEAVSHSFFSNRSGLKPGEGETQPAPGKSGAYSWLKAPRYDGQPMEVGPLARMAVVALSGGNPEAKKTLESWMSKLNVRLSDLNSVLGRHFARALEAKLVADRCAQWLGQLQPEKPAALEFNVRDGQGAGLMEAPRGALGHWISVKGSKIANYQCVVPSTWNCSPRDEAGTPGPVETALQGVPIADPDNPLEATRVVRSFDPCLACAVH